MKKGTLFPCADHPGYQERVALGFDRMVYARMNCRAEATGEFREPLAREWFLSGAIVEGYRAANDLSTEYHIARLVRVVTQTVVTERVTHRI